MSGPEPWPLTYAAPRITAGAFRPVTAESSDVTTTAQAPSTSVAQSATRYGSATYGEAR